MKEKECFFLCTSSEKFIHNTHKIVCLDASSGRKLWEHSLSKFSKQIYSGFYLNNMVKLIVLFEPLKDPAYCEIRNLSLDDGKGISRKDFLYLSETSEWPQREVRRIYFLNGDTVILVTKPFGSYLYRFKGTDIPDVW